MAIIECINVGKIYDSESTAVHALNNINLSIDSGELVAFMGRSGSGKSTLLHILGGIDTPTTGTALIDGVDVSALDSSQAAIFRRRTVGLIYQFFNLIPTANVKRNILMPLLLDNREPDQAYFDEVVEALGIETRLDAMPHELSGGQQQRVAIARSLIYRPTVLLADEPTGNLDRQTSQEIVDILKLANRRFKQTTVVITHDEEVAREADRVLVMEDGCILKDHRAR